MGTCEITAEPGDLLQVMDKGPLRWWSFIPHGVVQPNQFDPGQRQSGRRVRVGTVEHRRPQHPPGEDAE